MSKSAFLCYNVSPKLLYTKVSDKMAYANSADSYQEQSDLGLHCHSVMYFMKPAELK